MTARTRESWQTVGALVVVLGTTLLFYGHLLDPSMVLGARDYPYLHLPLRASLVDLVHHGIPWWNPMTHGGQPVLSNPHYGAFYPSTWLALLLPLQVAFGVEVVLHALLLVAGSWVLVRRLGGSRVAAALGAVAVGGSGCLLSLAELFNLFRGAAWVPWVVVFGLRALEGHRPSLVLAALAMSAQLLAGDPSAFVAGLVLLGSFAVTGRRRTRALASMALVVGLAIGLAAVQVVPTAARIGLTARAGMAAAEAGRYSLHPIRFTELGWPWLFGEPSRIEEELWAGATWSDQGYPLLLSLYPGLIVTVFGLAALVLPVPSRRALGLASGVGIFLALGLWNPFWEPVRDIFPLLGGQRFPEKLVLLPLFGLAIAAALAWDEVGRGGRWRVPAGVAVVVAVGSFVVVVLGPHALLGPLRPELETFVRGRAAGSLVLALAAAGLAVAHGTGVRFRWLGFAAVLLLAVDLRIDAIGLVPVVPAEEVLEPPPLAWQIGPVDHRLFIDAWLGGGDEIALKVGEPGRYELHRLLGRLEPYSGLLWGYQYAIHLDYDLLLTDWGRHALAVFRSEREARGELPEAYLGAWHLGTLVTMRAPGELLAEWRRTGRPPVPARARANPWLQPFVRSPPEIVLHPTLGGAVAAARRDGWTVDRREHLVAPGTAACDGGFEPVRLGKETREPSHLRIELAGGGPGLVVVASTFDPGWGARVDGDPMEIWPTAAGQMGVFVPAGGHELALDYRDPLVPAGAAVSILTFLGLAWLGERRWFRGPVGEPPDLGSDPAG